MGLRRALEEVIRRVPPHTLHVHSHLHELTNELPHLLQTAIYRITQELLNNVLKHAHATEAHVSVIREAHRVQLLVEDDGQGFTPPSVTQPTNGIGLLSIQHRVEILGGQLDINTRPGQGTIVYITFPLPLPVPLSPALD